MLTIAKFKLRMEHENVVGNTLMVLGTCLAKILLLELGLNMNGATVKKSYKIHAIAFFILPTCLNFSLLVKFQSIEL